MPVFWLALMLQVAVVVVYEWTGSRHLPDREPQLGRSRHRRPLLVDRAQHLALPVLVADGRELATYSRYMRASMLEVVNSDYVRTARAKGLSEQKVTMRHAFRNALIPLVTLVALNFGALLGGAIVTETVFALDGMGLYFVNALERGRSVPGHGVAHGHRDDDHHLQPDRRHRLRLPRPAGPL